MKKRVLAMLLAACMMLSLAACGGSESAAPAASAAESAAASAEEAPSAASVAEETEIPEAPEAPDAPASAEEETQPSAEETAETTEAPAVPEPTGVTVRVGSLKGPTSMGLVSLMDQAEKGESLNGYEFTMAAAADEINAAFLKGDLDMVLIPANVASVLYNKTEGQISVIDINTLGVLYMLESGESIQSVADLKGKTIYLPGKGTTPDYALQYILTQNGLTVDDVDLQYKSEGTEVIAALGEDAEAVGLLPQPAATTAGMQNENLRICLNLTEEWDKVSQDSALVTGVTVVRKAFLEEQPEAVAAFLYEHEMSAAFTNENVEAAADMVAALEIVPKAPVAAKAIPMCNITFISGEEMKGLLGGYLDVLFGQNPESVGGAVPGEDFYYLP